MPVTRSFSPLRTGRAERACQFSLNARTLPRSAQSSSATAPAPIIASRPVLTRRRRARIAEASPKGYREKLKQPVFNAGATSSTGPSYAAGRLLLRNVEEIVALEIGG